MKTKLYVASMAVTALMSLTSRVSMAQPIYSAPAPVHPAAAVQAPEYVPTTTVVQNDRDRDRGYDRDGNGDRDHDRRERAEREAIQRREFAAYERREWTQLDSRQAHERAEFMKRWGWDSRRVAAFDAEQARQREELRIRLDREEHERFA
jgi:hypothetical protein